MPRELPRTLVTVFSFLRQPKWIIFTLLLPLGIAVCLFASHWQYTRHVHRSALNTLIHTNAAQPVVGVADLLTPGNPMPPEDAYRRVVASGSFTGPTSLVRKRPLDGEAGFWVVDTLRTDSGPLLQVLRGWVKMTGTATSTPSVPSPPAGPVTVTGWLQASELEKLPRPTDLPAGQVTALDTTVLAAGQPSYTPYLVAQAMIPTDTDQLKPVPMPDPGLGPHLAYSWQWLFFAVLLPTAWVIFARREIVARREELAAATGAANGDDASDDPNGDERIDDEVPADR